MSDPWFKFFPEKWQGGVARLKPIERSIYMDLLAEIYIQDGPIKRDDKRLARLCGTTPKPFTAALEALIDCRKFFEKDGKLSNPAAQKLIEERKKKRKVRSEAAKDNLRTDENIISGGDDKTQQKQRADLANADTERERDRELELSSSSTSATEKIELVRKLESVSGNAMDWNFQAVAFPQVVIGWISGVDSADLEQDILPTIKAVCERRQARGDPRLNNWAYFRRPVFEARDLRLKPAANPAPQTPKARNDQSTRKTGNAADKLAHADSERRRAYQDVLDEYAERNGLDGREERGMGLEERDGHSPRRLAGPQSA